MKDYKMSFFLFSTLILVSFGNLTQTYASIVSYSFSGLMQGNEIFPENTGFVGSFSYELAQNFSASGSYLLHSYELTFDADPLPIPPMEDFLGGFLYPSVTSTSWDGAPSRGGAPVNNGSPSISVSNSANDVFSVSIERFYSAILAPGRVGLGGPYITFTDSTGGVFSDTSLLDLSFVGSRFNSGQIRISYSVEGGSSASQTGIISVPEPSSISLFLAGGAVLAAARRRRLV